MGWDPDAAYVSVALGDDRIAKHLPGEHDQSAHGSWADGEEIEVDEEDRWLEAGRPPREEEQVDVLGSTTLRKASQLIRRSVAEFDAAGGTITEVTDNNDPNIARALESLEGLWPRSEHISDDGLREEFRMRLGFTELALKALAEPSGSLRSTYGAIVWARDGSVAGAMRSGIGSNGSFDIRLLGSTGTVPGAGTTMWRAALRRAAESGTSMWLQSTRDAQGFYGKLGMSRRDFFTRPDAEFTLSVEDVKRLMDVL